jgi:hypothetical protein
MLEASRRKKSAATLTKLQHTSCPHVVAPLPGVVVRRIAIMDQTIAEVQASGFAKAAV